MGNEKATVKSRMLLWGWVRRRECLVPTWRGWLLLVLLSIGLIATAVTRVHAFLAINEPVPAKVLVVEGWLPNYVLMEAKAEFERYRYAKLYVTGVALENGEVLYENNTYADLGAASLIRIGMNKDSIQVVPAPLVQQDRTYASALALKSWFQEHPAGETSLNIVSLGTHARRSRLLYQKAFGNDLRVGVIAIRDRDYDPNQWWKFSQGVRQVVDELFAYAYARVVFPFM